MAKDGDPLDPLKQFKVETVAPIQLGPLDVSITNVAIYAFIAVALIIGFIYAASSKAAMVPGRTQSVGEIAYNFVANIIKSATGPEGMPFVPLIFSIFMFVLTCNLIGMIPGAFTVTSQLAVTVMLGVACISIVIVTGFLRRGVGFLGIFAPPGLPLPLYLIVVPIEIISFFARPFTLGIRLFANMLAGHMILKLFGGFVVQLGAAGLAAGGAFAFLGVAAAIFPLLGIFAVTGLEFLVAFLQAYVFALLTAIYLSDAIHDHH